MKSPEDWWQKLIQLAQKVTNQSQKGALTEFKLIKETAKDIWTNGNSRFKIND